MELQELIKKAESGEELSPEVFFDYVKARKNVMTPSELDEIHNNCMYLISKYIKTGQKTGLKKLLMMVERIELEHKVLKEGITQYVFQDDIRDYIDNVAKKAKRQPVKMIELERYEREVPDDVIENYEKVSEYFDKFYVLFTDYTGKIEKQIEQSKKEKDPILFGVFKEDESRLTVERFYYIGDWIDEYCDLTLDRMVNDVKMVKGKEIVHEIPSYEKIEELRAELSKIDKDGRPIRDFHNPNLPAVIEDKPKKTFIDTVKSFFGGKK